MAIKTQEQILKQTVIDTDIFKQPITAGLWQIYKNKPLPQVILLAMKNAQIEVLDQQLANGIITQSQYNNFILLL
jgi:hypothetical protein